MRLATIALLAAGLLAAPSLQAATKHTTRSRTNAAPTLGVPACQFQADRNASDIEGLKSQLMVTAYACSEKDRYFAFLSRYGSDIARQEQALNAYFKRSYGKSAQKSYDEYITQLADTQEQDGLKAGTAFCENLTAMFDEVMSLHDPDELHDYANSKVIAQPVAFQTCTGSPPAALSPSHKVRHTTKSKQKA